MTTEGNTTTSKLHIGGGLGCKEVGISVTIFERDPKYPGGNLASRPATLAPKLQQPEKVEGYHTVNDELSREEYDGGSKAHEKTTEGNNKPIVTPSPEARPLEDLIAALLQPPDRCVCLYVLSHGTTETTTTDSTVDDQYLATKFTELWIDLEHAEAVMRQLRDYFTSDLLPPRCCGPYGTARTGSRWFGLLPSRPPSTAFRYHNPMLSRNPSYNPPQRGDGPPRIEKKKKERVSDKNVAILATAYHFSFASYYREASRDRPRRGRFSTRTLLRTRETNPKPGLV
eukprot:TRINITY_DN21670_c0_g1_i1.p1 TRINITY_DN21670_c0_g1~~TRINITY_DN21670_c0_g1_i1.p1  ORF type:complete len:285 (-),score=37.09 TRINITY_DN21670_c0_g1_i1:287-1141(-)